MPKRPDTLTVRPLRRSWIRPGFERRRRLPSAPSVPSDRTCPDGCVSHLGLGPPGGPTVDAYRPGTGRRDRDVETVVGGPPVRVTQHLVGGLQLLQGEVGRAARLAGRA